MPRARALPRELGVLAPHGDGVAARHHFRVRSSLPCATSCPTRRRGRRRRDCASTLSARAEIEVAKGRRSSATPRRGATMRAETNAARARRARERRVGDEHARVRRRPPAPATSARRSAQSERVELLTRRGSQSPNSLERGARRRGRAGFDRAGEPRAPHQVARARSSAGGAAGRAARRRLRFERRCSPRRCHVGAERAREASRRECRPSPASADGCRARRRARATSAAVRTRRRRVSTATAPRLDVASRRSRRCEQRRIGHGSRRSERTPSGRAARRASKTVKGARARATSMI